MIHVKALSLMTYDYVLIDFPRNYGYRIAHFVTMSLRYSNEFYVIEGEIMDYELRFSCVTSWPFMIASMWPPTIIPE